MWWSSSLQLLGMSFVVIIDTRRLTSRERSPHARNVLINHGAIRPTHGIILALRGKLAASQVSLDAAIVGIKLRSPLVDGDLFERPKVPVKVHPTTGIRARVCAFEFPDLVLTPRVGEKIELELSVTEGRAGKSKDGCGSEVHVV